MLDGGFVLVHRSLLKWEWYSDANTMRLFIHLLVTVNYEPQKWQGIVIQRGQRVASFGSLAQELKLSVQNVRTAISHLKSTGEITHEPHSKYGLFTVVNYDLYQCTNIQNDTLPTVDQQSANNNGNKANKSNKAITNICDRKTRFAPPSVEDVKAYCRERANAVDPQRFVDYYASNGWRVGKNAMKDWKAAVRTWEKNARPVGTENPFCREDL